MKSGSGTYRYVTQQLAHFEKVNTLLNLCRPAGQTKTKGNSNCSTILHSKTKNTQMFLL